MREPSVETTHERGDDTHETFCDGFRAAIRALREISGGGYDAEVEREAAAQVLEDRLRDIGGKITAACSPPARRKVQANG